MEPQEIGIIGAVTGISMALIRLLEELARKVSPRKSDELLGKIKGKLDELHRWHDVRDSETGAPLWYDRTNSIAGVLQRLERSVERLTDVFSGLRDEYKNRDTRGRK